MTEKNLLELILQRIEYLTGDVGSLRTDMGSMQTYMGVIGVEVSELKKGQGDLIAQVGTLEKQMGGLTGKVENLQEGQQQLKSEAKKTNNVLENDIKPKTQVLFDGYVQNATRINRVESNLKNIR